MWVSKQHDFVLTVSICLVTIIRHVLADNASLQWGPYRPNLYIGIRPRVPESLLSGLMWTRADNPSRFAETLRHTCEQNEQMAGYGWMNYDALLGGKHVVNDTVNQVDLTTWFVKSPQDDSAWSLRVRGDLRSDAFQFHRTTVVFYIATEDPNGTIECMNLPEIDALSTICQGVSKGFDGFRLTLSNGDLNNRPVGKVDVKSLYVDPHTLWQAKSIYTDLVKGDITTEGTAGLQSKVNLQFISQTFEGRFEFVITFTSGDSTSQVKDSSDTADLSERIESSLKVFVDRFSKVYPPQTPFQDNEHERFSQELLSNLMGGIGYFYGTSKVDHDPVDNESGDEQLQEASEQGPHELLTAVPSRPFFPRGFLWDEGFHLQVIIEWDLDLAMEIVSSWFNLMDEEGWIAREQILGDEARSKVPSEFQTQYRDHANPPTLFIVVQMFLDKLINSSTYNGVDSQLLGDDKEAGIQLLKDLYPKLKKHYEWFRRSQKGDLQKYQPTTDTPYTEGYQWRGRTTKHILPSGLDDYPRGQTLQAENLHVDALAWVGSMATVLQKIAEYLNDTEDSQQQQQLYTKHKAEILRSLDNLHWSPTDEAYCDILTVENNVPLHACHKGYISILPFAVGMMGPDHPHINAILDLIEDPNHLWSPHGLRSLSVLDPFYGKDENYWRGPVWVNFNYMILQRLFELASSTVSSSSTSTTLQDRARKIYSDLRFNLVQTVFRSWQTTSFAWEQYSDHTGKGQRTQYFTGWTSLIVRIMAMPDLKPSSDSGYTELGSNKDYPVGSVFDYRPELGASGWSSLSLLVTFIMIALCVVFRKRVAMGLKKCIVSS